VLPIDLLVRLGNTALSRAEDAAARAVVSKRRDSTRTFGRDLLAFYESLAAYARTARHLALVIEQIDLSDPSGNAIAQSLDSANRLSSELAEIVAELIDTLWPLVDREYKDYEKASRELIGRRPSARAKHRAKVLSVVDPALFELAETTYTVDMSAIWIARRLNALAFDANKREVTLIAPPGGDLSVILGHMRKLGYFVHSEEWIPPEAIVRLSLADDAEQIQALAALLRENATTVEMLRENVASALRAHFTLTDLL
jgi:hypothetical protein